MKTFLTAFLLWAFHVNCTAQWIELNVENPIASYFTDVYAISPDVVIVVGANGTILQTTDGGTTWKQKISGTSKVLKKIRFSNANVGYIIGDQGVLLRTIDGGENWVSLATGHNANFEGLSSDGENIIYIAYEDNLLKSDNGGITWQNYPVDFWQGDIQFLTSEIGYASKSDGGMLKTTDGGKNWQVLNGSYRFHFPNDNVGFCYMDGLRKTSDGGNLFEQLGYGNKSLLKIFAVNENIVWGIITPILNGDSTSPGTVKITYDAENGYRESVEYDDNNTHMASLYFSNDKLGYAAGWKNGKATIWKNSTGNTLSLNDRELNNSFKVYPNPAVDEINIDLNGLASKNAAISINDISGAKLYFRTITSDKKVKLNTSKFSPGLYFITIETDKKKYAQKLIIH